MSDESRKIAAVQMASSPNVGANLLEAERLIAEAAAGGARLVVLPENFAFMGKTDRDLLVHREQEGGGPFQEFLRQSAKRYGIWLVGGTVPLTARDPGKARAACLVYDSKGAMVARYDKMHLFDVHLLPLNERYTESECIEPGDSAVTVGTPFGRLGLAVCYDLRFPELFRCLLDQGAEIVALPAAFTAVTGRAHWEVLVRARAIENLCHVVAAAQGGYHHSGRETFGHSMVVDSWGNVLGRRRRGTGVVIGELDRMFFDTMRSTFPAIRHRRLKCQ